eukprot:NODE_431_length_8736_cov_0.126780.p5 type:complete len:117 gc:universal NODE_431_length_8736_cov_0.126780:2601-2251(-)
MSLLYNEFLMLIVPFNALQVKVPDKSIAITFPEFFWSVILNRALLLSSLVHLIFFLCKNLLVFISSSWIILQVMRDMLCGKQNWSKTGCQKENMNFLHNQYSHLMHPVLIKLFKVC